MADIAGEQQTPTPTVAGCAELCLKSFQQCLHKAASVHARELSLTDDQLARFSVWAANIRVFAPSRGSLDYRLREAPDVQDAVIGLLEALNYRVQKCSLILEHLSPETSQGELPAVDKKFDQALQEVANKIGLLHRFSNIIRRASKETHNLKAAKAFLIRDDEGNDAEPFLHGLFVQQIRDRFPGASENIQQRLASTMLLRRKRILYRRSRYGKNPFMFQETPAQPFVKRPDAPRGRVAMDQPQDSARHRVTAAGSQSAVQSTAQTATTLHPDRFRKASSPSVVSVSKSIALSNHGELPFPPAPCAGLMQRYKRLKKKRESEHRMYLNQPLGVVPGDQQASSATAKHDELLKNDWEECKRAIGEVVCPFCFCALPLEEAIDEKKWKQHVKNDLDPYVCLFEQCHLVDEIYTHSTPWLKHMHEHGLRWRCTSKSHGEFSCATRNEYLDHMKIAHAGKFNDGQLEVLADRNGRMAGPVFKSCPLCGVDEVDGNMEHHVAGHLRLLALKSLPSYLEDTGVMDEVNSDRFSLATSNQRTRSTIRNDPDRDASLLPSFDEIDSLREHKGKGRADIGRSGSESRYKSWGGFRKYISKFPGGTNQPDELFLPPSLEGAYSYDTSSEFIEGSLFDGVPDNLRRLFEWGFVSEAHGSSADPKDDPVLQAFIGGRGQGPKKDPEETMQGLPYPDCAICRSPASYNCECEARGLDMAVNQAEQRVMGPVYKELRTWVRNHSQGQVLELYSSKMIQLRNDLREFEQRRRRARGEDDMVAGTQPRQPTMQESGQHWQSAVQSYPEVLEYYYSLAQVEIPGDDETAVRDPPLSALRRSFQGTKGVSRKGRPRSQSVARRRDDDQI